MASVVGSDSSLGINMSHEPKSSAGETMKKFGREHSDAHMRERRDIYREEAAEKGKKYREHIWPKGSPPMGILTGDG